MGIDIRIVSPDQLWDLRHRVLRPGSTPAAARFEGDDAPDSVHFGAIDTGASDGLLIGVATLHREPLDAAPAWRLRGMAVEPGTQRGGIGRRLLEAVDRHVAASAVPTLWCHARLEAVGFYERCGWVTISEIFDIPGIGPHRKMRRSLEKSTAMPNVGRR